jgi:asparagine N-glycosylation enzyme membrane subunit Stt3
MNVSSVVTGWLSIVAGFALYQFWEYMTLGMVAWVVAVTIALFLVILQTIETNASNVKGDKVPLRLVLVRTIGYTIGFVIILNIYNSLGAT